QLAEYELRNFIRGAVSREPQLSPELLALVENYHRANLIDSNLQSSINADIAEVTAPWPVMTADPPRREVSANSWFSRARSANSTEVQAPSIPTLEGPPVPRGGLPTKVRVDWTDSSGNTGGGLGAVSVPNTGPPLPTGSQTDGSAWDNDEHL